MSAVAVAFDTVSKRYARSRRPSVDGLTVEIPQGGVFGLLGPNGSGKTTTLRLLFGLVRADAGTIHVLGHNVAGDLPRALPRMGALIEAPLVFPGFTGRRNLEVLAATRGISARRVDEVLDIVDLRNRQRDLARTYSLGMKQRLGIACALLGSPELLVLDEPSNGLDPAGMVDMRHLIRRIADSGDATLIVSSHLLAEMEQTCDRVAILADGRLVAEGTSSELALKSGGRTGIFVEVSDPTKASEILTRAGLEASADGGSTLVIAGADQRQVLELLMGSDIDVLGIGRTRRSLEDTFLALTKETA